MNWKIETGEFCENFRFRGAGLANVVVAFERNDERCVWRFPLLNSPAELLRVYANYNYFQEVIRPLFYPDTFDLVAKRSLKVLSPEFVRTICSANVELAAKLSVFSTENNRLPIPVIEMPDFSNENLSASRDVVGDDVFAVEIKPKQGHGTGLEPFRPYCTNCLLQYHKSRVQRGFSAMYDFCPLKLFSGKFDDAKHALKCLLRAPHNNFRVFKNGRLIFAEKNFVAEPTLTEMLNFAHTDEFLDLLVNILLSRSPTLSISNNNYRREASTATSSLHPDCILGKLLLLQKLDTCGPVKAAELAKMYSESGKMNICNQRFEIFNPSSTELSVDEHLLKNCLIAATIKDCSIMISFCKVNIDNYEYSCNKNVQLMDTNFGTFAFKINLIDFDAKTPEKLIKYYDKLKASRSILNETVRNGCY